VNGRPIARPSQAHRVWDSLSDASALTLDLRRAGRDLHLSIPIVSGPAL